MQNTGEIKKKPKIPVNVDDVHMQKTDPFAKEIERETQRLKLSEDGTMGLKPVKKLKKSPLVGP